MAFLILLSIPLTGINNWEKPPVFLDELVCNSWDVPDKVLASVKTFSSARLSVASASDSLVILLKSEVISDDSNSDSVSPGLTSLTNSSVAIFSGSWVEVPVDSVKSNFGVNVVSETVVDFSWILSWVLFWVDILVCSVTGVTWRRKIKLSETNQPNKATLAIWPNNTAPVILPAQNHNTRA